MSYRINVRLYSKSGTHIGTFNKPLSDILDCAILKYQDRWFVYRHSRSFSGTDCNFDEVNIPTDFHK